MSNLKRGAIVLLILVVTASVGWQLWTHYGQPMLNEYFQDSAATTSVRPVALIPPLRSYSSVEQVSAYLDKQGMAFRSEQLNISLKRDQPRIKHILTADNFRHLEVSGQLSLHFYNDQLYETVFEPVNSQQYAALLRRKLKLRTNPRLNGRAERVAGNQRIFTNVYFANSKVGRSLRTQGFILWQDLKLLAASRQP